MSISVRVIYIIDTYYGTFLDSCCLILYHNNLIVKVDRKGRNPTLVLVSYLSALRLYDNSV